MSEQLRLFSDDKGATPPDASGRAADEEAQAPAISDAPQTRLSSRSALAEAIEEFGGAMILKGFTSNTINSFQADLRILTDFIAPTTPIGRISTGDLQDFLVYLMRDRGRPCNPKSYARRLTTLKVFFGWLGDIGALSTDRAAGLVHRPVLTPLPRVLSNEQVEQLLDAGRRLAAGDEPDARPLFLAQLLLQTGIKKSECMGIHLAHLDVTRPAEPVLHVRYEQLRHKYKERSIRLGPSIVPALRAYRIKYRPAERLFECTARNLEYVLRDLAELADIAGGVSFESLRWTAALRDFLAGVPAEALRHKLGLSRLRWSETEEKLQQLAEPAS